MMLDNRFWSKVSKTDSCWLWTSHVTVKGYGQFYLDGKARSSHRLAYTVLVGPIPPGLQLDHLCRNRACVNPAHLEPVTNKENQARGIRATSVYCHRGHEFTPQNTRLNREGSRVCRACHAASTLADYHRNKLGFSGAEAKIYDRPDAARD